MPATIPVFLSPSFSTGMRLIYRESIDAALEIAAVGFSIAFTLLYLRGVVPACYVAAFFGSMLFALLCWRKRIFAESALHVFYVGMAIYGLLATGVDWKIVSWPPGEHVPWLLAGCLGT